MHLIKQATALVLILSTALAWAAGDKPQGPHGRHDPHATLTADQHLTVALQHQREGREAEAIFSLDKAVYAYPDNAELRRVRGSMLLQRQQVSRALEDFEAAIRLDPNNAEAYVNRSMAYRHFDRIDDSLADLDKAIQINPDLIPARFNRGSLHFSDERYQLALADFDHCIAIDPHNAAPYFNRAATYDALGRRDDAVADMQRFIELSADKPQWQQAARDTLKKWNEDKLANAGAGEKQ